MTIELSMLLGSVGVLFAIIFIQSLANIGKFDVIELVGNRENVPFPQPGFGGRVQRALANHLESLAMFTPLILIAHVSGVSTPLTVMASQMVLFARIAHAVLYLIGIPWARTIAFMISLVAMGIIVAELISA